MKGTLRRFVGIRELPAKSATYELRYTYHLGRLSISSFEKTAEHHDV
ncbi:MAG: hypothetical protein ACRC0M_09070 [Legionella sp.]